MRSITGSLTGSLKIPVVTTLPCQVTSLGNPTFTDKIFTVCSVTNNFVSLVDYVRADLI